MDVQHSAYALAEMLRTLDALLGVAVDRQARLVGPATLLDPWRGMHLSEDEVKQVLAQTEPRVFGAHAVSAAIAACALRVQPIARLAEELQLCELDIALLAIVLAPDIDLRYERIYAYLQDDIARRRPSIDLMANLLATSPAERVLVARRFDADAPLCQAGVLEMRGAPDLPEIARPWVVETGWRHWLEGRTELDPLLRGCAGWADPPPHAAPPDAAAWREVAPLLAEHGAPPLHLLLSGAHGSGKFAFAQAVASVQGRRLLRFDLRRAGTEAQALLPRALRAAQRHQALLFVHGAAAERDPAWLADTLAHAPVPMAVATVAPLALRGKVLRALRLSLGGSGAPQRVSLWAAALARQGLSARVIDIADIASVFSLGAGQIEQAAADLALSAARTHTSVQTAATLSAAARALCGEELAQLAVRVHPEATFAALVTNEESSAQLHELCQRMRSRARVRETWTRDSLHARTCGVTALFAGPSGTGKTLAAEVIAQALGFDLFRVDLSSVVSKYIGETEKNLERVFDAASRANAVLLFDEADALFGKRSEVKDAHDRYANIEIAYLLQRMEQFDGLAILSTNLKQNLDDAFTRRLTFCVNFAFPEAAERRRLWQALWPPHAPRDADVDLDAFASEHRLSGGNIRNVILAAVHQAMAENRERVGRAHLLNAVRREFQKVGRTLVALPTPLVREMA
jgi:AAA+ superfamily predicted ATPase